MNKIIKYPVRGAISLCMILLSASPAFSQDSLKNQDIIVVKQFQPILGEAIKIEFNPQLSPAEPFNPDIKYDVPVKNLIFEFKPKVNKAVSLFVKKTPPLKRVYIKTGFGNYKTPLFEAYLNSLPSKQFEYGLHVNHLSSKGKMPFQQFSENQVHGSGKTFFHEQTLAIDLDYNRDVINFYGDTAKLTEANARQLYSTYAGKAVLFNNEKNRANIDYDFKMGISTLSGIKQSLENDVLIEARVTKTISNNDQVNVKAEYNYLKYKEIHNHERTFVNLHPYYKMRKPTWDMNLGGIIELETDSFHFFPDFTFSGEIIGTELMADAGWTGNTETNSFHHLSGINPYLSQNLIIISSGTNNIYAGIKGFLFEKLHYQLRFTERFVENMPFFVSDTADEKGFVVIYDPSTQIHNLNASLTWHQFEKFHVTLEGDYRSFSLDTVSKPWHTPTFKMNATLSYNIQNKILISADVFYINKTNANNVEILNEIVDINLGLHYRYLDNLSFFCNIRNMTGSKYKRWDNYQVYGLNVIGGFSYSF